MEEKNIYNTKKYIDELKNFKFTKEELSKHAEQSSYTVGESVHESMKLNLRLLLPAAADRKDYILIGACMWIYISL